MGDEIGLGVDILLHGAVHVQMVGSDVGDDGNVRRLAHGEQLEAGQLHHSHIFLPDVIDDGQEGTADIAALVHPIAGTGEKLGDQRGRSGLSVRTGNCIDLTGAELEEHLHLRGDDNTLCPCLLELLVVVVHARRTKDNVIIRQVV